MKKLICLLAALSIGHGLVAEPPTVQLTQGSARVWVHTSCETIGGQGADSNRMVIDCTQGVVLVDTCWNDSQTAVLLRKIEEQFHNPVLLAIITHAHVDRIGGIRTLLDNGIKAVSTPLTARLAQEAGYPEPTPELDATETNLHLGDQAIASFSQVRGTRRTTSPSGCPMTAWCFGGCLIKSNKSTNLGNIADADVASWTDSVRNLRAKFPNARIVIPGHGR